MPRTRHTVVFLVAIALMLPSATSAQRARPNACMNVLETEGLASDTFARVALDGELVAACRAYLATRDDAIRENGSEAEVMAHFSSVFASWNAAMRTLGERTRCEGTCTGEASLVPALVFAAALERTTIRKEIAIEALTRRLPGRNVRASFSETLLGALRQSLVRLDAVRSEARTLGLTSVAAALSTHIGAQQERFVRVRRGAASDGGGVCAGAPRITRIPRHRAPVSRTVLLYAADAGWSTAPLTETEHQRVFEAVRASFASRADITLVSEAETRAILDAAARGEALGREACADRLGLVAAIEDARPDALLGSVAMTCADRCVLTVTFGGTAARPPLLQGNLEAAVAGAPEDVASWLASIRALAAVPAPLGAMTGTTQTARLLVAAGHGFGRDAPTVRSQVSSALSELEACAPTSGGTLAVVLEVALDGGVRIVRDRMPEQGAPCRRAIIERMRFARARAVRRAVVMVGFAGGPPANATSADVMPPSTAAARMVLSDARMRPSHIESLVSAAFVACDAARVTEVRVTPVTIDIDALGRVVQATAGLPDAMMARCIERQLATATFACPEGRRPASASLDVCTFPSGDGP